METSPVLVLGTMPSTKEAIEEYYNEGWVIAAAINRGDIAHGHTTIREVQNELRHDFVTAVEFCPYHPETDHDVFGYASMLRKPKTGMLTLLEMQLTQDQSIMPIWEHSLVVGSDIDEEMASRAGIDFEEEWFDAD